MRVQIFIDDEREPIAAFDPPGKFELDTTGLEDGPHRLRIYASEVGGPRSVEEIPFTVRNGPGIAVFGLAENESVSGSVPVLINAYQSKVGDQFEPVRAETPAPIPTWSWVLFLVVGAWSLWYAGSSFRSRAAALAAEAPSIATLAEQAGNETSSWRALGEQVYGNYCSSCHQPSGGGLAGIFPPLANDPVVTADDPSEHLRIIINGLQGRTIGGVSYASPMPAFRQLSDEELAAVVNHERTNWGNAAPLVQAADVNTVRPDSLN